MRSHDAQGALQDALAAGEWVIARLLDTTFERFADDEVLRSAVERKLEVIGEALSRADRAMQDLDAVVPGLRKMIGLRNVLAHGYDVVDVHVIYAIGMNDVPELVAILHQLSGVKGTE